MFCFNCGNLSCKHRVETNRLRCHCKIISTERKRYLKRRNETKGGEINRGNKVRENRRIVFCGHPVRNGWLRPANATDRYVIIFASYRIRCWLNGYVRRTISSEPFHRRTYAAHLYRVILTRASNFTNLFNSISPMLHLSLTLSLSLSLSFSIWFSTRGRIKKCSSWDAP